MDPSSAIWDATKCLCGYVKQKADYAYHLDENLQSLEEKWNKLEDVKKDVEALIEEAESSREMQRSHQVRGWLNRLHTIQEEIKDIQVHGTEQIQNKCLSKCCPKNCMSSYKLGKNVAKILRNLDDLQTEGESFCKDFKIALRNLCKTNEMPSGETVGLDLMFDKVWKSIEEKNVGIIGLYGMGGVGKTTLLKKINNEFVKRYSFYVKWVVVSKSPNLDSIMENIKKSVGIGDTPWNRCTNQDEKAAEIYKVLKEKKFVLLFDDIWERFDLEKVGVPHPKETNFQSKVLFTTRFEDVCAKMKAQRTFKVEILTEKEAMELFCLRVGEETLKSNPIIPKIAEEMAKECKGLPLALTVVGSAMAGVKSVEAWEHSKNNLTSSSWTASDWETKVFSVLKFSYDQLPDETHKKCFLYCALYPEDHVIQVYDLIDKWIGEGFLNNDRMRSVHDMRSHGGSVIEKLKLSCLIESVEDDIFFKRSIKMHDVIRDMALWIARDQDRNKKKIMVTEDAWAMSQVNVGNWEMVEKISIMDDAISCLQSTTWTNLITLLLKFNLNYVEKGLRNIHYARRLKILELNRVPNVHILTEIGGLILLEYLSLDGVELIKASDISRELRNLKNLKIFHLYIDHGFIPLGLISNLQQLKVFGCHTSRSCQGGDRDGRQENEFLEELEGLSNLEELWVEIKTQSGLEKLFESTKSQSCIYSLVLSHLGAQINMQLLLATMSKMKHLQRLVFKFLNDVIHPFVYDTCCLSTLRTVEILGCHRILHLTWLKYAQSLQELVVEQCSSIEEVIKGERLEDEKDREHVDSIFSSLVVLELNQLQNLRSIHKRVLSFPSLRSIKVIDCKNLKKLPFDSISAKAKLRFIKGSQKWWDNLEWDKRAIKATFESKFQVYDPYYKY